jgi:LmbE family N-acetylglucosaminyl deacetylase
MKIALIKFALAVKHALKAVYISVIQGLLFALARDATPLAAEGPILVVAPHPDDETLGGGGFIARARRLNQKVRVVVATDGGQGILDKYITSEELVSIRQQETQNAVSILGMAKEDVVFLNIPDSEANRHIPALEEGLRREIEVLRPQLILSPHRIDKHPDHNAVTKAVDNLCQKQIIRCPVYEYPIWFWPFGIASLALNPGRLRRLRRVNMQGYSDIKMQALKAHRSQFPHLFNEFSSKSVFRPLSFQAQYLSGHELFFERDSR